MSSLKSKELKARKKLEKAFTEWFITIIQSNTMKLEEKLKNKLTPKEWEQLNRLFDESVEELKKNPNLLLVLQNFNKKLQRHPLYKKLADIFKQKKARTDYIT